MHARVASGVFLALGFADLAVLNLLLAPRLVAERSRAVAEQVEPPRAAPTQAAPAPRATETRPIEAPLPKASAVADSRPENATPDVLFSLESYRITSVPAARALLRLADELRTSGARRVLLRGHADRLGSPAHNLTLSRQRAEAVRHLLIAHGAPGERIALEAVGDAEPADPSDTPVAWAQNRRVQVLWR